MSRHRISPILALFILALALFGGPSAKWDPAAAAGYFSVFFPQVLKGGNGGNVSGLQISSVADNRSSYPGSQIPAYEKFEITFQIANSAAKNFQMPYDPSPPGGIVPEIGITVNAQFSQDNFQTVYPQPAFYYEDFDHEAKSGRDWIYPNGNYSWKVRFAPPQEGTWQFRLTAQDASGMVTTQPQSFAVSASDNHGFVRVAKKDSRYFEFEDGTYFPGLGYNMNYNHINWLNPILDNQTNFQEMNQDGIQFIRIWLSEWSIYGSAWNPWYGLRGDYDGYIPRTGLTQFSASPGDPVTIDMKLAYSEDASGNKNTNWFEACRFLGTTGASPVAIKQDTVYHYRVRYRTYGISGPRNASFPNYGFVVKIQNPNDGNWHTNCYEPGLNNSTGEVISAYAHNTSDWSYLEGDWNFGSVDFLPNFYLALENVNAQDPTGNGPMVYIDTVEIQEKRPDGTLGPNVVSKPSMQQDLYFEQRNSYAFDEVLDLAKQYDIYLKPVIFEKNDVLFNWIDYGGNYVDSFDNDLFYGDYRNVTKVRWLQQAWWRYLQARWGYSTNIHSWELLNEGDPYNSRHYTLADEFGKYMRQFAPDNHMVTTSFWHSFPKDEFWANPQYPNVDYADIHQYIFGNADPIHFYDSALATESLSTEIGAKTAGGASKPTIRGETGFVEDGDTGSPTTQFVNDTQGIWLHKFVWGQINPGGMLESYWYDTPHIYSTSFDLRDIFGTYSRFIKDVPLNNGLYVDAQATASDTSLRVVGQKDPVSGKAHLWIDNKNDTWKNVVDGVAIAPVTGTISVPGMPQGAYTVSWFDTYAGTVSGTADTTVGPDGNARLVLPQAVASDIAVKLDRQ